MSSQYQRKCRTTPRENQQARRVLPDCGPCDDYVEEWLILAKVPELSPPKYLQSSSGRAPIRTGSSQQSPDIPAARGTATAPDLHSNSIFRSSRNVVRGSAPMLCSIRLPKESQQFAPLDLPEVRTVLASASNSASPVPLPCPVPYVSTTRHGTIHTTRYMNTAPDTACSRQKHHRFGPLPADMGGRAVHKHTRHSQPR